MHNLTVKHTELSVSSGRAAMTCLHKEISIRCSIHAPPSLTHSSASQLHLLCEQIVEPQVCFLLFVGTQTLAKPDHLTIGQHLSQSSFECKSGINGTGFDVCMLLIFYTQWPSFISLAWKRVQIWAHRAHLLFMKHSHPTNLSVRTIGINAASEFAHHQHVTPLNIPSSEASPTEVKHGERKHWQEQKLSILAVPAYQRPSVH